tara:strand:+ start:16076 stop:16897 length:822 start_codon:yes stop_codon:yes gene_type:complete
MPRLSISTWTLHRLLGRAWFDEGEKGLTNRSDAPSELALTDVPRAVAEHGIGTLELCHFHFPRVEDDYLAEIRGAANDADVDLFSVLIDTGNITSEDADVRESDVAVIERWMERASHLGTSHVRIIAGDDPPTDDTVDRSVETLRKLAAYGESLGVRVLTENFKQLGSRPETVNAILDGCEGRVGLCADFGNFPRESRQEDLKQVMPRADSIHAKADYPDGVMDAETFDACVKIANDAGFDGPISLIYQDGDDVWERVDEMAGRVTPFLGKSE